MDLVQIVALIEAAENYREACLIQAAALTVMGDSSRDSYPDFTTLNAWFGWAADHTHQCSNALRDVAIGEPVWTTPSPTALAAGSRAVRIF